MASFNWIDYILLIIVFYSLVTGLIRGLVYEVLALITWVAAIIVACMFSESLSQVFINFNQVEGVVSSTTSATGMDTSQPISYVALGISFLVLFLGTLIVGKIFNSLFSLMAALSIGNRLLGGVFGFLRGLIINLVLIFLLQLTSIGSQPWWTASQIVNAYQPGVRWLEGIISPTLAELQGTLWEKLQNVQSNAEATVNEVAEKINNE